MVCHGSEPEGWVAVCVLGAMRDGDADSVGVAVPMGARLEGCVEEE